MSPDSDNKSEAAALSAAKLSQDPTLVGNLLAKHRAYLRRVVEARMHPSLGRRVDASDVVQEAQMEAVRRVDDFLKSPQVPLKIWLRKLVVERLIMFERKHLHAQQRAVGREQHAPQSDDGVTRELEGRVNTPSRIASRRETSDALRQAVDSLQESDREIIFLHLYEGLNSQESATVLGIEAAAARKRLGRAVQRLRKVLDTQGLGTSSL